MVIVDHTCQFTQNLLSDGQPWPFDFQAERPLDALQDMYEQLGFLHKVTVTVTQLKVEILDQMYRRIVPSSP